MDGKQKKFGGMRVKKRRETIVIKLKNMWYTM